MSEDWADAKAREWLDAVPWVGAPERHRISLASLLREVKRETTEDLAVSGEYAQARADMLAEARRVVEEEYPLLPCPCCEGQGEHIDAEECTFAFDAPDDYERLSADWERRAAILDGLEAIR